MQVLTNLDLNKNQILNLVLQMISGNHATPVEGLIWYDSTNHVIKYRTNTTTETIPLSSASGVSASTWDANSLVKADADNTPIVLPVAADTLVGRATGVDGGVITDLTVAEVRTMLSLADENLQDIVGAMVSGGTETGISVTYDDANARLDFVVGALNTLTAPTGDLSLNSHKITNLATPTADTDAATKAYVDATAQGLSAKASVRAATTAAITLATGLENGDTIDGVTLATGDRVLVKNQAAGAENGIYTVNASGAPTRATDFDSAAEIQAGAFVFVEEGTTNADTGWVLTTDGAITLETTALDFTQFSGAGQITAGAALTKTGNTLDVAVDNSTVEVNADALRVKAAGITESHLNTSVAGAGLAGGGGAALSVNVDDSSLEINSDTLRVKALGITDGMLASTFPKKYAASIGNGSNTSLTVTHNLNTKDVTVSVRQVSDDAHVLCDIVSDNVNTVTLTFAVAPASNALRVVVIG